MAMSLSKFSNIMSLSVAYNEIMFKKAYMQKSHWEKFKTFFCRIFAIRAVRYTTGLIDNEINYIFYSGITIIFHYPYIYKVPILLFVLTYRRLVFLFIHLSLLFFHHPFIIENITL